MAKDRESAKEKKIAMEVNIVNEFGFAVNIIPSKGGKFATGCKFEAEGNFATKGILAKKG